MNEQVIGIIDEVNNFGLAKGSHIKISGEKYSCYSPTEAGLDQVTAGQEVQFEWFAKGDYKNIKGKLKLTGNHGTPKAQIPTASSIGGGKGASDFPIGALDGRRNITRRDAITQAVLFVNAYASDVDTSMELEYRTRLVLETARVFESYTSGDDDIAQAEKASQVLAAPTE